MTDRHWLFTTEDDRVANPFPLLDGRTAWFDLPRDLTAEDAEQLAAIIASLAE